MRGRAGRAAGRVRRGAPPFSPVAVRNERVRAAGWARERYRAGARRSAQRDSRRAAPGTGRSAVLRAASPPRKRLSSRCHRLRGRALATLRRESLRRTAARNAPGEARQRRFAADETAAVPSQPRPLEQRLAPLQSRQRPLAGTRRRSRMTPARGARDGRRGGLSANCESSGKGKWADMRK